MLDRAPGVVADIPAERGRAYRSPDRAPADGAAPRAPGVGADERGRANRSPGRSSADGSRPRTPGASADKRGRAALLARVDGRLPRLRPAERRVAQLLLEQPARAIFTSVVELAELASTSSATVVRCAKQLGFGGFHELKTVLARELADSSPPAARIDAQPDARLAALAQVTAAGAASVRDAAALVDPGLFEASVAALDRAERVLVVGVGSSAALCQAAASRFAAIGLHAEAPVDVHDQHLRARLLRTGDVCLVFSHTGASREMLSATHAAVRGGATTIAITSFALSTLVALVDHALVVGTGALAPHLAPLATRLAHLALLDSLVVAVALRDEPRTRGALARRADAPGWDRNLNTGDQPTARMQTARHSIHPDARRASWIELPAIP